MANPLYPQFAPKNDVNNIISQARNFKNNFNIDARQEVQRLLNSGEMTQEQFNRLMPIAQRIAGMMK